jgi:hypothetical protein
VEFAGAVNPEPGGVTIGGALKVADTSTVKEEGMALGSPLPGHGLPSQHPTPQQHDMMLNSSG